MRSRDCRNCTAREYPGRNCYRHQGLFQVSTIFARYDAAMLNVIALPRPTASARKLSSPNSRPLPSPTPRPAATPPSRPPTDSFRAGTYNLAAGNTAHSTESQFQETKQLAAREMVSGRVDVMALQEVGVNGRNTRGRDNNEELLEEVFRQELPASLRQAQIAKASLDEQGRPVLKDGRPIYDPTRYADSRYTATGANGESRHMTLTRERYNKEGREVPFGTSAESAPTVVYSAKLEEQDKTYSLAYASNNADGSYGNAMLLGPGYEIDDVAQKVLGHDHNDHEQRSALAVTFTTPQGQEATAISAHLSNGRSQQEGESRLPQLRALSDFADDYDNAMVLGDYNTYPGQSYGQQLIDLLPFIDPDKTPSASQLGFEDPDRGVRSIDRLFTQGDVVAGQRREYDGQGGSDHDLVSWDVSLPGARRHSYGIG